MQPNRALIVRAAGVAAALGIAGVNLVYDSAWGIGASLFALSVALGITGMAKGSQTRLPIISRAAFASALLFAVLLSWRSAPELRFLNGLTMILFAGLGTAIARRSEISLADVTWSLFAELFRWLANGLRLVGIDLIATRPIHPSRDAAGLAVGRGVLVSLPLVLVFGGLLYSADAGFEHLVRDAFEFDASALFISALSSSPCC